MALPYALRGRTRYVRGITALDVRRSVRTVLENCGAEGPFPGYEVNREPMLDVMRMHREACAGSSRSTCRRNVHGAQESWDTALTHGEKYGYKNSR